MTETITPPRPLASLQDNREAILALAQNARRGLALFSRDLEPVLYDTTEFVEAVQKLVLSSRYARVRMVVVDPSAAIHDGHRLVTLGRRLTSFMEFRRPDPEHACLPEAFLLADDTGLLYRPLAPRYEGFVCPYNPAEARPRLRSFEEIWERATPEPEFRRLGI